MCVSPWTRWQEPSHTRVTVNAADFTWAQFVIVTSFRDWQLHANCGYFLEWQFKLSSQLCIKHMEGWLGRHAFFSSLTSYFPNWNLNILAFQRSFWTSQVWSAKGVFLNEISASQVKTTLRTTSLGEKWFWHKSLELFHMPHNPSLCYILPAYIENTS